MEAVDDFSDFRETPTFALRMLEWEEGGETVRRFFSCTREAVDYVNKLHAANTPYVFKPMHCPGTLEGVVGVLNMMDSYRSAFDSDVIPF